MDLKTLTFNELREMVYENYINVSKNPTKEILVKKLLKETDNNINNKDLWIKKKFNNIHQLRNSRLRELRIIYRKIKFKGVPINFKKESLIREINRELRKGRKIYGDYLVNRKTIPKFDKGDYLFWYNKEKSYYRFAKVVRREYNKSLYLEEYGVFSNFKVDKTDMSIIEIIKPNKDHIMNPLTLRPELIDEKWEFVEKITNNKWIEWDGDFEKTYITLRIN